jgi:hypothetical protein
VYGTINKKSDSATRHIDVTLPKITLVCGPLVGDDPSKGIAPSPAPGVPATRGDSVTCSARAYFRNLALGGWTFTADDPAVGTVTGNTGSTGYDWAGPAVASGAVTVQGTVNGVNAISDTGRIIVRARSGFQIAIDTGTGTRNPTEPGMNCYHSKHWEVDGGIAGWTREPNNCEALHHGWGPDPDTLHGAAAFSFVNAGGPNNGLAYLSRLSQTLKLRTQIMEDARTNAPGYWVRPVDSVAAGCQNAGMFPANADSVGVQFLVVDSVCMQRTGTNVGKDFVPFLWRHESCHMTLQALVARNDPQTIARLDSMESLIRPNADTVYVRVFTYARLDRIRDAALASSDSIDQNAVTTYEYWGAIPTTGGWRTYLATPLAKLATGNRC